MAQHLAASSRLPGPRERGEPRSGGSPALHTQGIRWEKLVFFSHSYSDLKGMDYFFYIYFFSSFLLHQEIILTSSLSQRSKKQHWFHLCTAGLTVELQQCARYPFCTEAPPKLTDIASGHFMAISGIAHLGKAQLFTFLLASQTFTVIGC